MRTTIKLVVEVDVFSEEKLSKKEFKDEIKEMKKYLKEKTKDCLNHSWQWSIHVQDVLVKG